MQLWTPIITGCDLGQLFLGRMKINAETTLTRASDVVMMAYIELKSDASNNEQWVAQNQVAVRISQVCAERWRACSPDLRPVRLTRGNFPI